MNPDRGSLAAHYPNELEGAAQSITDAMMGRLRLDDSRPQDAQHQIHNIGQRLQAALDGIAAARSPLTDHIHIPGAPDVLDYVTDDLDAAEAKLQAALAAIEAFIALDRRG